MTIKSKYLSADPIVAAVQQDRDPGLPPGSPDLLLTWRAQSNLWQFSIRSLAAGRWLDSVFGPEWTARWRQHGTRPITDVCYPAAKLQSALEYFAAQGLVVARLQ